MRWMGRIVIVADHSINLVSPRVPILCVDLVCLPATYGPVSSHEQDKRCHHPYSYKEQPMTPFRRGLAVDHQTPPSLFDHFMAFCVHIAPSTAGHLGGQVVAAILFNIWERVRGLRHTRAYRFPAFPSAHS